MFLFVPFPLYILIFPEIWVFYQVGIFHVKFFRFPMFWSFNIKTVQRSRQVWKVRGLAEINHTNFREFRKVFPFYKKDSVFMHFYLLHMFTVYYSHMNSSKYCPSKIIISIKRMFSHLVKIVTLLFHEFYCTVLGVSR